MMRGSYLQRSRRSGFTLVDLSVTVLVVGILAATTAPRFAIHLADLQADAAVQRLLSDLTGARHQALVRSTTQTIQFDVVNETYQLLGRPDPDHPSQVYTGRLSAYPYRTDIVTADFGGDAVLNFDLYGRPDTGGVVTLRSAGRLRTVTINPATGRGTSP